MWETKKLSEVGDIVTGNTPSTKDSTNYGSEVPFVKPPELQTNLISGASEMLSNKGARSARVLPSHSVMVSCIGNLGKVAVNKIPVATNQQINSVIPDSDVHYKFLFYLVQSQNFRNQLESLSSATTVSIVNKGNFSKVEIPVPPLPTQHRIVEKIEELFSELDNGVENLKKAQQQLKTYRQAVLKDAFEGKLTAAWRKQQNDLPTPEELLQQIKAERKTHRQRELAEWKKEVEQWEKDGKVGRKPRKPRKAKELDPIGEDELIALPEIPENWKYVRIGNVGDVRTGATPLKKEESYYENGKIPWVTSGALNNEYVRKASDFVTKKALDETNLSLFPKHTLLVAMYGEGKTRGKCSELLIEATTNQAIAAIVQNEAEIKTKDFLKYFLLKNYNDIRRMSSGGVQPNLNLGIIENTIIPLASAREQQEIVNEIESRLSVVDQLEQTIEENLQKAEALRQSILKKAFSGELVEE